MDQQELNSVIDNLQSDISFYSPADVDSMLTKYTERKQAIPGLITENIGLRDTENTKLTDIINAIARWNNDYWQQDKHTGNHYAPKHKGWVCTGSKKTVAGCQDHNVMVDGKIEGLLIQKTTVLNSIGQYKRVLDSLNNESESLRTLIGLLNQAKAKNSQIRTEGNAKAKELLAQLGKSLDSVRTEAIGNSTKQIQQGQADAEKTKILAEAEARNKKAAANSKNFILIIAGAAGVLLIGIAVYHKMQQKKNNH